MEIDLLRLELFVVWFSVANAKLTFIFLVLDLTFDLVLGMPWLMAANPRMDWV